jgi:hypothetical protein
MQVECSFNREEVFGGRIRLIFAVSKKFPGEVRGTADPSAALLIEQALTVKSVAPERN